MAWRDAFKTEALAAGVSAATFDRAFAGVLPNFDILAKDDVQPEYTKPIWAYLDTAVSPEHVATGRQRAGRRQGGAPQGHEALRRRRRRSSSPSGAWRAPTA